MQEPGLRQDVERHGGCPDRLIPAYEIDLDDFDGAGLSEEDLRRHFEAGDFQVLGEIAVQYEGIAPDDARLERYWALAEELDVPVGLHLGEGYPGAPYLGSPEYRVRLGSPLLLEEVLVRHPDLRLWVMHYGSPFVDEMIALMFTYPQIYVDVGGNVWHYPREYFYSHLKRLVDAGFGQRILFGSDQMHWPELIEISIDVIEDATFLSEDQKRDILYHNAARFLRLSDEEIARHHGGDPSVADQRQRVDSLFAAHDRPDAPGCAVAGHFYTFHRPAAGEPQHLDLSWDSGAGFMVERLEHLPEADRWRPDAAGSPTIPGWAAPPTADLVIRGAGPSPASIVDANDHRAPVHLPAEDGRIVEIQASPLVRAIAPAAPGLERASTGTGKRPRSRLC